MSRARQRTHIPQQARSLRTQERLLAALESLLESHDLGQITVQDITARAHVSVGAFYKRFSSKKDLLPLLLSRIQTASLRELEREFGAPKWRDRGLADRIDELVALIAEAQLRRRRVISAFVSGRFAATLEMSAEDLEVAQALMTLMHDWLLECRQEILHAQPETAVRIGLYLCLQSLQTALLFETAPAQTTAEMLIDEAKRMLRRYLTGSPT